MVSETVGPDLLKDLKREIAELSRINGRVPSRLVLGSDFAAKLKTQLGIGTTKRISSISDVPVTEQDSDFLLYRIS